MSTLPKIGNMAPAFTLLNQDGEKVALKDFKGKKNVVLYFYPRAMTPGCTVQACAIRDVRKEFDDLDTVVLGMSPDPVKKLKGFEEKKELNFTLLSDEDHKIADKYGIWGLKKFAASLSRYLQTNSFEWRFISSTSENGMKLFFLSVPLLKTSK